MTLYNAKDKKLCVVCNVSEAINKETAWCLACQMNADGMLAFAAELERISKSLDNAIGFAFQKQLKTIQLSEAIRLIGMARNELESNKLYKVDYASKYRIDLNL